jgi:TRAP-type transport system small permease protein
MSTVRSAAIVIGRLLSGIEVIVASVLLAVMVALVFLDVLLRYLLNAPITGTGELAGTLFVWVVLLGAAAAARRRMHVGVGWFVDQLPARAAGLMRHLATLVVLVILLTVAWFGIELMQSSGSRTLPLTDIPLRLVYAAVPIGCVLSAIGFVASPDRSDEPTVAEPIG